MPPVRGRLDGKTAIVTGGGSGIGLAAAVRLSEEGAAVAVAELDEARGREALRRIEDGGGRGLFVRCGRHEGRRHRASRPPDRQRLRGPSHSPE